MGFITDLPHLLVESFKATLQDIHFADVILHVRDISHPHTEHQKDTVLDILEEVGVSQSTLDKKYIELWNKIDLVKNVKELQANLDSSAKKSNFRIVPISCITGENIDILTQQIGELATVVMDKRYYTLTYDAVEHNERY